MTRASAAEVIDLSPVVADEVKYTTCYMCACRCGIKVHLKDGRLRYIEGNRNHPVNKGVLCGKGSAGIMQHYSPARLRKPLLRVGERGAGEFKEIEWEEALALATRWLGDIRASDPKRLAFFTGRDQSQSLTGWWAKQFGTPNFAAHGGFCSVNMATAGLYSIGGSFWEFGEPDWDRTKYLLMFGVAEDHDSNPIKTGLAKLKARGAKFVSLNPVQTGYSALADEFLAIRPGTDGLFVLALVHELLRTDRIDLDFLASYSNAIWLVISNPGGADDGLFARDADGKPLAWDRETGAPMDAATPGMRPAVIGDFTLPDGRRARPVFQLLAERYLDGKYVPDWSRNAVGYRPRRSGASRPSLRTLRSTRRSSLISPGPIPPGGGTRRWLVGRCRCMRCAASPPIPMGFRPAARCICCRCCLARSIRRGHGGISRRIRSRSRRRPVRSARAASRGRCCRAWRWDFLRGRRTCCSMTTARRSASTRRSPGMRRWPRTA